MSKSVKDVLPNVSFGDKDGVSHDNSNNVSSVRQFNGEMIDKLDLIYLNESHIAEHNGLFSSFGNGNIGGI